MNGTNDPERETEYAFSDSPSGYTGETDRVSGEYHYKSGYTQQLYSDAHYVPADESTVPPRYYTPPVHSEKDAAPRRTARRRRPGVRLLCACLACLLIGAGTGAALTGRRLEHRFAGLESRLAAAELAAADAGDVGERALAAAGGLRGLAPINAMGGGTAPAAIYDMACRQVVGITTEVTYTNFFGLTSSSAVTGSGFIVSEDGYVITNYHVIDYAYQYGYAVTVMLHDGTRYPAEIVGVEESDDIAVLKIDARGLTPVIMGDSNTISVGDELYAVGNPLGELEFTMTFGRVSALDRLIRSSDGTEINMFQFDAAVNSGNSGGPAYNAAGEVVGIVTAKYSSTGVEGLGFAIPMNDAADIAADLITRGYVSGKAYLGVQIDQRYNSVYSRYYALPNGAYVSLAEKGSCADKAGIQTGDIITAVGSYPVRSWSDLNAALRHFSAGDSVDVTVYRAGESIQRTVVFDEATG